MRYTLPPMELELKVTSPYTSGAEELFQQLNAHNLSHYEPEQCHLDTQAELAKKNCTFILAYSGNQMVGMGAVKLFEDYGEIKRMFVPSQFRGQGIAKKILERLLQIIHENGRAFARLETGDKFVPAVKVYRSAGFVECPPFGYYSDLPPHLQNLYMEKQL